MAGAVLVARWRPQARGWWALAAFGTCGLAPASLVVASHPLVVVAAYAVVGVGIELCNVSWFTATQQEIAADKLARVSSPDFLFSYGLAPVGLALVAPAAAMFGMEAVLVACAAVCVVAPALAALAAGARTLSSARTRPPR